MDNFERNRVIHICADNKGGTEKYVNDLIKLYPKYEHRGVHNAPFVVTNFHSLRLIHIHSSFFESNIGWEILEIVDQFKKFSPHASVYLTIHDYQWLFENNSQYWFKTVDDPEKCLNHYKTYNNGRAATLFDKVDKIFIPSQKVYDIYVSIMGTDLTANHINKIHIVQHSDIDIRHDQLYIPIIIKQTIRIAFVGTFNEFKGARLFLNLLHNFREYHYNGTMYRIEYHIFGKYIPSEHDLLIKDYVHFHCPYNDNTLIEDLYKANIHIVTSISLFEETYCYSLSLLINSGLPIVYLNRGSLLTRLNPNYPRMFSFDESTTDAIIATIRTAIEYVVKNQGRSDRISMSTEVHLNNEYRQLYLCK